MVATRRSTPLASWFFIILFGAIGLIYLAAATAPAVNVGAVSHAIQVHQSDAERVREACQNGGFYKSWLAPDGKRIDTCFVGNQVGFRVAAKVNGKWEEVTAYFRDKLAGQGRAGIEQWARDFGWKALK